MINIELQRARSAMAESVTLPIAMWLEALDELEALRQTRLVQQAEQKPVAIVEDWPTDSTPKGIVALCDIKELPAGTLLYASPATSTEVFTREKVDSLLIAAYTKGRNDLLEKQAEQKPAACEPVLPIDDDGWSDWICPKPQGYLMQCCDCGLIHEVDSRVAQYEPRPSEDFVVVNDQNMQAQWRMRRRDDLASPQQAERMVFQAREIGESEWFDVDLNETERINAYINSPHIDYRRLYAAPVRTKDLTEPLIDELRECRDLLMCVESCSRNNFENLAYERVQAIDEVIAADREKNK